jgi:hypothetical protein
MTLDNLVFFFFNLFLMDRDPHGSALMVSWITDLEEEKLRMKIEKVKKKIRFRSAACALLKAKGFSCQILQFLWSPKPCILIDPELELDPDPH